MRCAHKGVDDGGPGWHIDAQTKHRSGPDRSISTSLVPDERPSRQRIAHGEHGAGPYTERPGWCVPAPCPGDGTAEPTVGGKPEHGRAWAPGSAPFRETATPIPATAERVRRIGLISMGANLRWPLYFSLILLVLFWSLKKAFDEEVDLREELSRTPLAPAVRPSEHEWASIAHSVQGCGCGDRRSGRRSRSPPPELPVSSSPDNRKASPLNDSRWPNCRTPANRPTSRPAPCVGRRSSMEAHRMAVAERGITGQAGDAVDLWKRVEEQRREEQQAPRREALRRYLNAG